MTLRVMLHWDENGELTFAGEKEVEFYCIDERTPSDRIYITSGSLHNHLMTDLIHDVIDKNKQPLVASIKDMLVMIGVVGVVIGYFLGVLLG